MMQFIINMPNRDNVKLIENGSSQGGTARGFESDIQRICPIDYSQSANPGYSQYENPGYSYSTGGFESNLDDIWGVCPIDSSRYDKPLGPLNMGICPIDPLQFDNP